MTINFNTVNLTVLLLAATFATGCEEPTEPETSPMPATEELSRQELDAEAEAQRQNAELREGVQQEIDRLSNNADDAEAEREERRTAMQKRLQEARESQQPTDVD